MQDDILPILWELFRYTVKEEILYYDSLSHLLSISLISISYFELTLVITKRFTAMTLCQFFRVKILTQKDNIEN